MFGGTISPRAVAANLSPVGRSLVAAHHTEQRAWSQKAWSGCGWQYLAMALFGIRFDFRNPPIAGTTMTERYRAALDMVEWADGHEFVIAVLSEHHGADDGYLPSPLTMAAAMAARTESIRIEIAAIVASFHDPLRLAEDAAVVDLISGGRLDLVVANGYVGTEFAMFDRPQSERATRLTEAVRTMRQAWTGEPFEFRGRTVRVTPTPHQDGGPHILLGGSSEPAARRAARIGDGFLPSSPELWASYREEMLRLGKPDPGPYFGADTSFFHLASDVEQGWAAIAPYALHEMNAYGRWMTEAGVGAIGGYHEVGDSNSLRETGQYRVLRPDDLVADLKEKGPAGFAMFHPMMGGIPPDLAWQSLRLFEREVLPRL
jgi:alkanesulfonate monooxygenase SsuD/methylene tetrahydromethanopterin reductase-like flavin-dependent oxidoreductase (luciferase family)